MKKSLEKNGVKPYQKVKKFLDIRKSKNVFMSYRKSVKTFIPYKKFVKVEILISDKKLTS